MSRTITSISSSAYYVPKESGKHNPLRIKHTIHKGKNVKVTHQSGRSKRSSNPWKNFKNDVSYLDSKTVSAAEKTARGISNKVKKGEDALKGGAKKVTDAAKNSLSKASSAVENGLSNLMGGLKTTIEDAGIIAVVVIAGAAYFIFSGKASDFAANRINSGLDFINANAQKFGQTAGNVVEAAKPLAPLLLLA